MTSRRALLGASAPLLGGVRPGREIRQAMGYRPQKRRTAWEDRFRTPTVDDLREHYNKQLAGLLETARTLLLSLPGVVEELSWQGLPWRWTLTYRFPEGTGARPGLYLVPDPLRPKISMPLPDTIVQTLPLHRLKRHVRDGVTQGRRVNGVLWATWEVTSKTQVGEILEIVNHKQRAAASRN